jgi:hypothetical protein
MSDLVPQLPDLATQINAEHAQVRSAFRTGLDHALACGKLLIRAKDSLPHGQWLPWLEEHCPDISERLAQRYMRVARDMPRIDTSNPTRVSDLSLRQALELLAYTTKKARREGIDAAEAKVEKDGPIEQRLSHYDSMRHQQERIHTRKEKKRQHFAQRNQAAQEARVEEFGPPPPAPGYTDNQWSLHGFDKAELEEVLQELTRVGQWLDDLVGRTARDYEYAVSWAAKRAAGSVWQLRERLTYDRDHLQYAVYGLRDLVKDGGARGKDIRRWAKTAGIGRGLLALAWRILGIVITGDPNGGSGDYWILS